MKVTVIGGGRPTRPSSSMVACLCRALADGLTGATGCRRRILQRMVAAKNPAIRGAPDDRPAGSHPRRALCRSGLVGCGRGARTGVLGKRHGLGGQETTGVGGMAKVRTISHPGDRPHNAGGGRAPDQLRQSFGR